MAKVAFVHLHPQNAYLAKCLWHLETQECADSADTHLVLFSGPCFLVAHMSHYHQYMLQQKKYLESRYKTVQIIYPPTDIVAASASFKNNIHLKDREIFVPTRLDLHQLWDHAIYDSLYRNLWQDMPADVVYSLETSNKDASTSIFDARQRLASRIYDHYSEWFQRLRPTRAYLSHQSYDFYMSFFIAAENTDTPVTMVHGGHQYMYDIDELSEFGIGKDCPIKQIGNQINEDSLLEIESSNNTEVVTRIASTPSSRSILSSTKRSHSRGTKKAIIIVLPIFCEIQIEIHSTKNIFRSRRDWLYTTLQNVPDQSSIPIIIRMHPNTKDYHGELEIVQSMLKEFTQNRINPIYVCSNIDEFEQAIESASVSVTKSMWVMFQGSLTLELPTVGIKPFSGVIPVSPTGTYDIRYSIQGYVEAIRSANHDQALNEKLVQRCKSLIKLDNRLTKGSTADKYFRRIDETYHFGNISDKTEGMFVKLIDELPSQIQAQKIKTSGFTTYLLKDV